MRFYELVFITRPELLSADIDRIIGTIVGVLEKHNGKLIKNEYWGLRSLKYEIQNTKKGHYVMLGIQVEGNSFDKLSRELEDTLNALKKDSNGIIRFVILKVNEISQEPSPILSNKNTDQEEVIDVTVKPV